MASLNLFNRDVPRMRHLLSWKTAFYDLLPPLLRRLGPRRGDVVLAALGRATHAVWPPRRSALHRAAESIPFDRADLAAHVARFLARDYPLDGLPDREALGRFDLEGAHHLDAARAEGRGVVLVGSHFGAHVAGLHALYRLGLPLRLLVQRPRHVSRYLQAQFDRDDRPHPQSSLFLRRNLPPREAADRLLRARAALRDGMILYLSGDIPWPAPGGRPGRLLGRERPFLTTWADLAAIANVPAVPVFATFGRDGRYALAFDAPIPVRPGRERDALDAYLDRLDARVAEAPAQAVAYLTWPCYAEPPAAPLAEPIRLGAATAAP
jgi:lauroyl/myristoyl acyltransferase